MLNNIYKTLTSSQMIEANIQSQAVWWQQQPIRSELSSDTYPASPISEYKPSKQYWQANSIHSAPEQWPREKKTSTSKINPNESVLLLYIDI